MQKWRKTNGGMEGKNVEKDDKDCVGKKKKDKVCKNMGTCNGTEKNKRK